MADKNIEKDLAQIVKELTGEVKDLKEKIGKKSYLNSFLVGLINGGGKIIGMVIVLALVGWYLTHIDIAKTVDRAVMNWLDLATEQAQDKDNNN